MKETKQILRQIMLAFVVFMPLFCKAQHFTGKCNIPAVNESGYYHLLLSPEVIAISQPNLGDIRIKNNKSGKEVPYLLRSENPRTQTSSFQEYKIIENNFDKRDSITRVIIENEAKEEIKQFYIVIQNAEISKYISVKGSEDQEIWYAVKQRAPANSRVKNDAESEILIIDIPAGRYRYYEILIDNPQKDPIRILNVGKYQYGEILGKYTEVALGNFIQKDSTDKYSYIYFPDIKWNYLINRIHFEIEEKQPYYRQAWFSRKKQDTNKNVYFSRLSSFVLSSKAENKIDVYNMYIDTATVIIIDNKDNNPLKINKITAYQLNRYLTLYLEKGESYTLYSGEKTLSKPQYDMEYFEKNIPGGLPVLELSSLQEIEISDNIADAKKLSFWETQIFLWVVILGVGLLLGWICYVMVGEIKKR